MESSTYKPIRVQRKRTKGFRLPPNTKSVCRPGPWGNPFRKDDVLPWVANQRVLLDESTESRLLIQEQLVKQFERLLTNPDDDAVEVTEAIRNKFRWMGAHLDALKGYNLACFCPLIDNKGNPFPCHVDILLSYSNA